MSEAAPWRRCLRPLEPLYRMALAIRKKRLASGQEPILRLRFPVVSVGNLSTGGAGKTPLTIALAHALRRRGMAVDVLSRGYGRRSREPARVNSVGTATEFGDEPLLIARATGVPVYVAPQRYDAGLMAESVVQAGSAVVHLLDDGFQHRQVHRDVDILLIDPEDWRDSLLPAGNLREPLEAARRATVLTIPAEESGFAGELRRWGWDRPIWRIRRVMDVPAVDGSAVAFCGIARSGQFFDGLEAKGMRLSARIAFPDHHMYSDRDLRRLLAAAQNAGAALLVTTEKDHVRLGALASELRATVPLKTAGLRVQIEAESSAIDWLIGRLEGALDQPSL